MGDRHLLLMIKETGAEIPLQKFLCGHDEREWFVATVPEKRKASNVEQAKEALKPAAVINSQHRHRVRSKNRNKRRNAGFIRQGEWFFIPAPDFSTDERLALKREPLQRGGGKPHVAEFLVRSGGTTVYVSSLYPRGLTADKYRKVIQKNAEAKKERWQVMQLNPGVYVKGKIRHPDHKTLKLPFWHRVVANTESEAASQKNLVFLD